MLLKTAHSVGLPRGNDGPIVREIAAARKALAIAWNQFDQAEPAFVDPAIHRLIAAEQTYCRLLSEQRNQNERNDESNGQEESQSGARIQKLG